MSTLDKPHYQLENLSRRFIHESNPDDADTVFILYNGPHGTGGTDEGLNKEPLSGEIASLGIFYGEIDSLDEIRKIASFQDMYEHNTRMSNDDDPSIGGGDIDDHSIGGEDIDDHSIGGDC
ncbi:hypothetical protein Tco_0345832 [Tanacetum coccineum]